MGKLTSLVKGFRAKSKPVQTIAYLHIGKTGGSYLASCFKQNTPRDGVDFHRCKHNMTYQIALEKFGPDSKIAFSFRDPTERFISGFYSRLRQGRPTYKASQWSPGEGVAFNAFPDPNALAEALASKDDLTFSNARFAMHSINHMKRNYKYTFGLPKDFDLVKSNVVACVETKDIDENLEWFLGRCGFDNIKIDAPTRRHAAKSKPVGLSEKGEAALRSFWRPEYALYEKMQQLYAELRERG